jgi:hypothetical protein
MIKTQHCPNCEATEQKLSAFKQEVSDKCWKIIDDSIKSPVAAILHSLIIPKPKPDPLVDILLDMELSSDQEQGQHDAKYLRAKLEACGLEIREKGQ